MFVEGKCHCPHFAEISILLKALGLFSAKVLMMFLIVIQLILRSCVTLFFSDKYLLDCYLNECYPDKVLLEVLKELNIHNFRVFFGKTKHLIDNFEKKER